MNNVSSSYLLGSGSRTYTCCITKGTTPRQSVINSRRLTGVTADHIANGILDDRLDRRVLIERNPA